MNRKSLPTNAQSSANADTAEAQVGLRLAAALSEYQAHELGADLSPDIASRLRFARDKAMAAARQASIAAAAAPVFMSAGGSAVMLGRGDGDQSPWWLRLGSLLPLAVLLGGLMLIDSHYTRSQIDAAAEVDAALLADDLPPEAYRDQGFVEFLKSSRP